MSGPQSVKLIYQSVVNDVIDGVREAFLDDGTDDHVLQELRQLWESKLEMSKALENTAAQAVPLAQPMQFQQKVAPNNFPGYTSRIATQQQQQPSQSIQPVSQLHNFTVLTPQVVAHQNLPHQLKTQPQHLNVQQAFSGQQLVYDPVTKMLTAVHQPATSHQQLSNIQGQSVGVANGQPVYHVMQAQGQSVGLALNPKPTITRPSQVDGCSDKQRRVEVFQFDGLGDSSSDDEEDVEQNEDEEEEDLNDDGDTNGEEEDPLNSADDVSDADPTEVFDADNVVVCQFDKINRCKTKWKFHLKDGIMNLLGKDHVFFKATGDAEW